MGISEIVTQLVDWTPYLAQGYLMNLLISGVSMAMGTILGVGLAGMRHSSSKAVKVPGSLLTDLFRNIPSFVFLFYLAFIMPVEFSWSGKIVAFPVWIKAALALTVPVIGFSSDQALGFLKDREQGAGHAVLIFSVAWTQYFLIIIMASATASVIGVNEILGRANTVIASIRIPEFMLWMYLYVALWFFGTGLLISRFSDWMLSRFKH